MQSLLSLRKRPGTGLLSTAAEAAAGHGATHAAAPRKVGKYLVSPLVKRSPDGWFASSVSIRSGSGRGTSDRVLRLTRLFRCATEAAAYAHDEGLRWISASRRLAAVA